MSKIKNNVKPSKMVLFSGSTLSGLARHNKRNSNHVFGFLFFVNKPKLIIYLPKKLNICYN